MRKDDCIFCKIAAGEIPSETVYEDEDFRVILDLNPASKVASAMKEALCCTGINLVQNNGESAGQTVKHFHLHLIPRYDGDSAMVLWKPGISEPEEQKRIAMDIKAKIK